LVFRFFLGRPAAKGTADDAQYLDARQRRARHENTLILEAWVWWNRLETSCIRQQQVIRRDPFYPVPIPEGETEPKSGSLRPGRKDPVLPPSLACVEIPNKTNHFRFGKRNIQDRSSYAEQFDRAALKADGYLYETRQGFPVEPDY